MDTFCITAMINHVFISFSAVQIYDLFYIHLHTFTTGSWRILAYFAKFFSVSNLLVSQRDGIVTLISSSEFELPFISLTCYFDTTNIYNPLPRLATFLARRSHPISEGGGDLRAIRRENQIVYYIYIFAFAVKKYRNLA